jgi:hypothetical protein
LFDEVKTMMFFRMTAPVCATKLKTESFYQKPEFLTMRRENIFFKHYQDILRVFLVSLVLVSGIASLSCTENAVTKTKASSALIAQVALRQQQLATPTEDRLQQMQSMGMRTDDLGTQRIFVYLKQRLNPAQITELTGLGITVYPDSWIPPVGNHSEGFVLADMPVGKLDALAAEDFVIRLDTAEQQLQPQVQPQSDPN